MFNQADLNAPTPYAVTDTMHMIIVQNLSYIGVKIIYYQFDQVT